jgi:ribosome-binding protein aMBF1 (putative translation factor)
MIRNEAEYKKAVEKLDDEGKRIVLSEKEFAEKGFTKAEIKRLIDPLFSFRQQLHEEVESYEKLKRGEFPDVDNFDGIGRLLISLRIAIGMSQRDLAKKLGVNESMVSRDERNEYHGISFDRAGKILDALGVRVETRVVAAPLAKELLDSDSAPL